MSITPCLERRYIQSELVMLEEEQRPFSQGYIRYGL